MYPFDNVDVKCGMIRHCPAVHRRLDCRLKEAVMHVLISGSSGLIGSALRQSLEADGHTCGCLPRSFGAPVNFSGADAVVHLAGENIAQGRWTPEKKRRIEKSRVDATRELAQQLAACEIPPPVFVCASAVGFYGDRGNEPLTEESPAGSGFLPEVCRRWEAAAQPAADAGIRTVHIRTGIVLSPSGGALQKMLPPFRAGLGGPMGSGSQFMSWISLTDEIGAIRFLIDHPDISGEVNLTAPHPVSNRDFARTLGRALHRPACLPLPAVAVRLLFGEMGEALLLGGARVLPGVLTAAGYAFRHPRLEAALEEIL